MIIMIKIFFDYKGYILGYYMIHYQNLK